MNMWLEPTLLMENTLIVFEELNIDFWTVVTFQNIVQQVPTLFKVSIVDTDRKRKRSDTAVFKHPYLKNRANQSHTNTQLKRSITKQVHNDLRRWLNDWEEIFSNGPFSAFFNDFEIFNRSFLIILQDFDGPFSKLMGTWRITPCLPNHWSLGATTVIQPV